MKLHELLRERALVESTAATIAWDQETYLPAAGVAHRAHQLSWLAARAHEMATGAEFRAALEEAEAAAAGDPETTSAAERASLCELRRCFDRAVKLPVALVARASEATSLGKHAWSEARKRSDFQIFAPHLRELVAIAKEQAERWGYREEAYDALLDGYERNTLTRSVAARFDALEPELREISAAAVERSRLKNPQLPSGPYPVAAQQRFNARVAAEVGFDFSAGRIDETTHPFCTRLGPRDVRLTTRYEESDFTSSLFGVLHEAGHGLYELGMAIDDFGTPAGEAVSLGIHESQSRLWENHIGRSRGFWEHWYPFACECFPQLIGYPLEHFLDHVQRAAFSPIRVEADEATYDLHIFLRFGLERRMISGELEIADIPAAWNEAFAASFGFRPKDDREGCLQDIHWSMGGIGYFSTYSIGNMNAAQLFEAASSSAEVASGIARADYLPVLSWMRERIHRHGALEDPDALIERATGKPPRHEAYLAHLRQRYTSGN